jgi:5-methylcytosine-specific restriction endonuclease McrA
MKTIKLESLPSDKLRAFRQKRLWQRELWAETDGICQLCGRPTDVDDWNMDHIRPKSRGGTYERKNLQIAHYDCNVRKGNSLPK